MSIHRNLRRKYVYVNRIFILLVCFCVVSFLTYVHNSKVATETTSRDFSYNSWQLLTRNSNLFQFVKNKDALISVNQNDAFETNAGSFFWNTGIRLSYFFNAGIIWPNYAECKISNNKIDKSCDLSDVRGRVVRTIPNLQRGAFVPLGRNKHRLDDWVNINSKPGALDASRIWWFDIFLMTPSTMVAFLAPFDESAPTASVRFRDLRFVTISKASKPEFSPAIDNVCLEQDQQLVNSKITSKGLTLMYWKVPKEGKSPDGKTILIPTITDIRQLTAGAC